jgi:4,5-dihydroxyphthalate decarboxylase
MKALIDGSVAPEGVDLIILRLGIAELFHRMLGHSEFDMSEISMASYVLARSNNVRLDAIPVFPVRNFRHSFFFVNSDSGVTEPRGLIGKKVGLNLWQNTAAVWMKGFLQHDYDVPLDKIRWFTTKEESFRIPWRAPKGISIEVIPAGADMDDLLERGEIDAVLWPKIPIPFLRGSMKIKRLFPDYFEVEREYFKRTGIFPIMHVIAIKSAILEQFPWLATTMYNSFVKSKTICYERMTDWFGRYSFPWSYHWMEIEKEIFGNKDPYPYGLSENRKVLVTLIEYLHEQSLMPEVKDPKDFFFSSTLET